MSIGLFLKNVPPAVKELIGKEAFENRRSVNQEAIALLEEALVHRVETHHAKARSLLERLRAGTGLQAEDATPVATPVAPPAASAEPGGGTLEGLSSGPH
jgi:hypothetical protein